MMVIEERVMEGRVKEGEESDEGKRVMEGRVMDESDGNRGEEGDEG